MGTCWATGAWATNSWAADTWASAVAFVAKIKRGLLMGVY